MKTKEGGRKEKGWIDSLVWLLRMQWLHVIWLEQKSQEMHTTQIWHSRFSMSCWDSLKKKMAAFDDFSQRPFKTHPPSNYYRRAFMHLLLMNHMNSNQCDSWQLTLSTWPQLEEWVHHEKMWKLEIPLSSNVLHGEHDCLCRNSGVCGCRGERKESQRNKNSLMRPKWIAYNNII